MGRVLVSLRGRLLAELEHGLEDGRRLPKVTDQWSERVSRGSRVQEAPCMLGNDLGLRRG